MNDSDITRIIYLDHAATTPVRRSALEAMWPYLTTEFGNPASHHEPGAAARSALTAARTVIAGILGVRPDELIFTSGGTESDNLAIKGIALAAARSGGRGHIITTRIEHSAILESADYLRRLHGVSVDYLDCDSHGRVDPRQLDRLIRPDTAVVSVQAANNEVGTVQDLPSLGEVCARHGVPLHTDAVQAAGQIDIRITPSGRGHGLGVDALSLSGHKIGAPKGIGLLWLRSTVPLEPLIHGGKQQRGLRSGTENVAGAVALASALAAVEVARPDYAERLTTLRDGFISRVLHIVPGARLTGDPSNRLPSIASFTIDGVTGETMLIDLEQCGVVCSSGPACSADSFEPSHVLRAIGIDDARAGTALRFSLGHTTTAGELRTTADCLARVVTRLRSSR
ncbi:cysteine desulfurase family protein [Corynebacterium sp. CCM 9204]|uniref:cysteine desulfurase family protein n=1 Tax=Corynebacterium sp. CCM 9204 TaxID=3057616 RepID=UPI0035233C6D